MKTSRCALLLASLACLAASATAFAIPEGPAFQAEYQAKVLPYYQTGKIESFEGVKGITIETIRFEVEHERGALVVFPGKGEPSAKYAELVYDLRDSGYSIYLIDHRGQGTSGRMTSDPQIQYVDEFQDYVDDAAKFVDRIVNARPHARRYLLAHSMGGAIGALYLMQHPATFDKAVLSSPMFAIDTSPYLEPVAYGVVAAASVLHARDYALGQTPYDPNEAFSNQTLTHSRYRFEQEQAMLGADPALEMGGASNGWIKTSIEATWKIRWETFRLTTPVLLFQAGEDTLVRNSGEDVVCALAASCVKVTAPFERSDHEMFMEQDPIRDEAVRRMLAFFQTP